MATDYELSGRSDLDPDEILRRAYAGEINDPYSFFDTSTGGYGAGSSFDFSGFDNTADRPGDTAASDESTQDYNTTLQDRLSRLGRSVLGLGGKALDFATSDKGILALLLAGLASGDRRPAYGGGTRMAMPVAPVPQRMAAQGGLMQAYRQGGSVRPFPMQDGGFVMTKRAVDGAGGPRGIGANFYPPYDQSVARELAQVTAFQRQSEGATASLRPKFPTVKPTSRPRRCVKRAVRSRCTP
jgi:hypothetical protein